MKGKQGCNPNSERFILYWTLSKETQGNQIKNNNGKQKTAAHVTNGDCCYCYTRHTRTALGHQLILIGFYSSWKPCVKVEVEENKRTEYKYVDGLYSTVIHT